MTRKRSTDTELAARINQAYSLLEENLSSSVILARLVSLYGISNVQARRYLQKARSLQEELVIPEPKQVFTVKLPLSLVASLKAYSQQHQLQLSEVVCQALEKELNHCQNG